MKIPLVGSATAHPRGPNVLISSAGRRVALVQAFQSALAPYGGRVIATDADPMLSAACQVADELVQVPPIKDFSFLPTTKEIALSHDVGLVIPTLDTELLPYAKHRDAWEADGVQVSISTPDLISICRDKRRTATLFESLGISPIQEIDSGYPRFIKPVDGSLSQDIHLVEAESDLPPRLRDLERFIHQEPIDRTQYDEYTVDLLYSTDSTLVGAVPRRRIEVRGGEISKGRTEKGFVLELIRSSMAYLPGARGGLTVQVFGSEKADRPVIGIEINARFGGGYPMSHAAGADYASWLLAERLGGQVLNYREDWKDGTTFLRYDEQVVVSG